MSTATTIAVTVLALSLLMIAVAYRARGIGPLILAGVVLGAAAGISATLLAAGLT
jgi:hypothetical protein